MAEILKIYNADGSEFGYSLESYTWKDTALGFETTIVGSFVSELPLPDAFKVGMYVLLDGVKYIIFNDTPQTRDSAIGDADGGLYRYTCTFYSPKIELTVMPLVDSLQGGRTFIYFSSEQRLFDLIESNLPTGWSIEKQNGLVLSEEVLDDPLSFSNATVSEAVEHFHSTHNLTYNVQGRTIFVGQPIIEVGHTFRIGYDQGLKTTPITPKNNKIGTRVFPMGSTMNIPYPYPRLYDNSGELVRLYKHINIKGQTVWNSIFKTNLMPRVYRESLQAHIDNGFDAVNYPVKDFYDAIGEGYVNQINPNFVLPIEYSDEELKPTIEGMSYNEQAIDVIKSVSYLEGDNDNVSLETGAVEKPNFYIELYPMGFDLYAQAAATGAMTISIKSGDAIGCNFNLQVSQDDFDRNFYDIADDGTKTFNPNKESRDYNKFPNSTDISITVLVQKDIDTYGWLIPNQQQRPQSGDKFVLLYIEMPLKYVVDKEIELEEDAIEFLKQNNSWQRTYPVKLDEGFLSRNPTIANQINTNSIIKYAIVVGKDEQGKDIELELVKSIQSITKKYLDDAITTFDVELTDEITISKNAVQENTEKLDEQENIVNQEQIKNAQRARWNNYVIQQTLNGLFDAEGNNRVDKVEANIGSFLGLIVGQNANDFAISNSEYIISGNSIQITTGVLQHFWYEAPFENKTWNIQGIDAILLDTTKDRYYVYIQANRENDSALWVISEEQKLYNEDENVWFFNSGQLIPTESGWAYQMSNGITSTIGGYVSTHQIKSPNFEYSANVFTGMLIDFLNGRIFMGDNAEIIARKISFYSPDGYKDLEETLDELGNIQVGGVNLLDNSNGSSQFASYNESILTKSVVEEFGFTDANRVITSGGYGGYAEIRAIARMGTPADGEVVSLSFYIKNNGTEDIRLASNQGGMGYTLTPNESKVVKWEGIVGNGLGAVQIQVRASSAEQDLDFTWSRIMYERGNRSTDWFPSANDLKSTGKGILSIQNFYLISPNNTGVTTSTSGWQEAVINPTAINKYLWNYEKITYTDGSFTDSTPAVISMYAADGIGISQIVDYYAVNNSTTPPLDSEFSTDVKNPTSTNRYLWNYEAIGYTNGTIHTSDKRIIGVYGERGEDGQPALPTVYRMSDTQPSKPTSSSVPPPNWSLTPPSASEVMSNPAPIDNPMLLSAPLGVTVSPAVVNKNSGDAWTGDEVEVSMILSNGQKQILTYSDGRDWTGNNQWAWDNPSSYRPTTSMTYLLICETSEGTRSYQGQLTVVIQGGEKVLSYIDVISSPNKTTYNVGEVLDTNGMIVRAYYTDGTSANLSNSQVSESYNFSTAGTKTVTVSYGGKSDTFSVTVVESSVTLSSIDVVNLPTKTTYYVGDVINTSGMVVNAVYSNGSSSTIPNNQIQTSYNFNTTGTKTVTVSYSGKSDTFSVSVVARPAATLSRIDVITAPQKTSYKTYEYIDTNGLYVLGTYSDGTTADVTSQCTYSPQVFTTTGLKTVTVSFSGKSDTFTVDIYTEESSSGTQIWACTALGWNESGGVTGWSEPTRWNGEDGARNAYTLFSFAYGASLDIRPSSWSYSVPAYVEGQHLWQRVQQYEPNSTNTGWVLVSTSYSVLREYIDDKIDDAKNEAISTFFEDAISAEEIEKLKNGSAPFVFDTDKQVAYLRKAIIEYLATDQILTDLIIAKNIKTSLSGERVEITQASRGLTAFDEDGNIAMKVHGKEFSTFSSAPTTVAVAQKSINQEAGGANPNDNIGETDIAIATITIAAGKDVNEVTLPAATIDLQALVELGGIIEGLGNARIGVRLMLDNIELGSLGIISINGTISNSTTIPSQKLSLASGSHNLYFRASWDCTVSEGAERAEVVGSVRWASSTIQIDYKDDVAEFSKEGFRLASDSTHYLEYKRLSDGTIQETRVGVTTNATYGVLASGMISAAGDLSKPYGKVTSSSSPSTGMFRINHSIGHTNYTPQVTLYGEAGFADIQSIYSTYFIIRTRTTALDLDDKSFTFACLG